MMRRPLQEHGRPWTGGSSSVQHPSPSPASSCPCHAPPQKWSSGGHCPASRGGCLCWCPGPLPAPPRATASFITSLSLVVEA